MAAALLTTDVPLKRKQKVVATTDLPGVPEGTAGSVLLVNGFAWTRYRVLFENGEDLGTLDRKFVATPAEYKELQRKRESGELDVVEGPAAAAGGDGGAAPEADAEASKVVNGVTVPGHLITRSASARARLVA